MSAPLNRIQKRRIAVAALALLLFSGTATYFAARGLGIRRGTEGPLILVIFLIVVVPGWFWWRMGRAERDRRANSNQCLKCGYDLYGNVSGVCPECGRSIRL